MKIIKTSTVAIIVISLWGSPFAGYCYEHLAPQTAAKWVRAQPKDPATQQAIKSRIRPILIGVPPNFAKGRIDHDL